MIVGTLALLFLVPVLFIAFEFMQEKVRPTLQKEADAQVQLEHERSMSERNASHTDNTEE